MRIFLKNKSKFFSFLKLITRKIFDHKEISFLFYVSKSISFEVRERERERGREGGREGESERRAPNAVRCDVHAVESHTEAWDTLHDARVAETTIARCVQQIGKGPTPLVALFPVRVPARSMTGSLSGYLEIMWAVSSKFMSV